MTTQWLAAACAGPPPWIERHHMSDDATSSPPDRPAFFPWPPVLFAGAIVAAWLLGRIAPLPWPGINDTAARLVGAGFGIAGVALMAWAVMTLVRGETTVMPNKGATNLVTSGPYALRRNPIYLAEILLLLGAAELTQNIWFVILVPLFAALVTWLAIIPEERHLEARFGDAWRDYAARTRRWI